MRSNITIGNIEAEAILIKSPYADVGGMFNVTGDDDDSADDDNDKKS